MSVAQLTAPARPATEATEAILKLRNVEVVYDHVILVLKGVSLQVPRSSIVALLGANGAGKSTTLKTISGLLRSERGEITKGAVEYEGLSTDVDPVENVKRGLVQVMEGRRCFPHLTIEENLLTGAHSRADGRASVAEDLERVYRYFPRLKVRSKSYAGLTSGGEQQMCAIGRALMTRPRMVLLDEPSMGLAPQLVEEIFEIVKRLNEAEGVSFLIAEQNTTVALAAADFGYILENGRVVMEGTARDLRDNPEIQEFYLGVGKGGARTSFRDVKHYKRRKRWII